MGELLSKLIHGCHIFSIVLFPVNASTLDDEDQELSTDRKLPLGTTLSKVYMKFSLNCWTFFYLRRNSLECDQLYDVLTNKNTTLKNCNSLCQCLWFRFYVLHTEI